MAKGIHPASGGEPAEPGLLTPTPDRGRAGEADDAADGRSELLDHLAQAAPEAGAPAGGDRSRAAPASVLGGADGRSALLELFARDAAPGARDAERSRIAADVLASVMAAADGRSALLEQLARARPEDPQGGAQATAADILASLLAAPEGRSALLQQLARAGAPAATPVAAAPTARGGAVPALVPGAVIGRFELLKEIGRGGFGVVFEARDRELGRSVAFKAVRPGARTRQLDAMLLQEAESAARLQHENIVSIFDYGQGDAGPYLVLELLRGETLSSRLARGPLKTHEAVHVATQVARALAHAHGAGLLHRDLKPGNVFLTESGGVKVMDLGLAHFFGTPAGLSGTPAYMAPEQWKGEPQDGRTDVFALGVTLFEMLAARRPYEVRSDRSTVLDPGPAPRLDQPHVPARLRKLVERCIAKDPARRPASARAVLEELLSVERAVATGATRRGQLFLVLVLGGALTAIGAAGVAAWKLWPRPVVTGATRTVLIADFENRTGEDVFDGTLEPGLALAMEGASFISTFKRTDAQRIAAQMKVEGKGLDGNRALLVARREGIGVVVTGAVANTGKGYEVSARAVDAFANKEIVKASETVAGKDGVLAATTRFAARVRKALGDATPEGVQLKEAETFSAASLEAAHEYAVGTTLAAEGKSDEAISRYREALRLDPGLGRAYTGIAAIEYNRGNHEEGKKQFDLAMAHVDRMSEREKYRSRGLMYLFQRDPDKAIEAFGALVKQYPADNAGAANLAIAYEFKGDFARALEMGRRAVEISPHNVPQRNNVGFFATYVGDFDAAIREQEKVLELNPRFVNGYVGLALAQLAAGRRDDALATWKRLESVGPDGASAAVAGLADVALYEGRLADARALLEKGIEQDLAQKRRDAAGRKMAMLAGAYVAAGQPRKAVPLAERALKTSDADAVLLAAATALAQAGEEKRAYAVADVLDRRVEAEPRMYAELVRGAADAQRRNHADAVAHFKGAVQLRDAWLARYALARGYLDAGSASRAQDELERLEKRRGEATDAFHDGSPTYRLFAPVLFELARARAAAGSPVAVDSYRAFLGTQRSEESPMVALARRQVEAAPTAR